MPSCRLQIYEKLSNIRDDKEYWDRYVDFYEDYWGGPTSPYGVWFGNEYATFQESLADHLSISTNNIRECLFIRENDEHYICLLDSNKNGHPYSFLVDNVVPIHWFFLFSNNQKKTFKTHYGFGSIHYTSTLTSAQKMIEDFALLNNSLTKENEKLLSYLSIIQKDLNETKEWCKEFSKDSRIILNYGDLLASFPPTTLDKEDSVKIISDLKVELEKSNYTDALSLIEFLISRWSNIEFANQENITKSTN